MADVALDPYTDHGHDGILMVNNKTIMIKLLKFSLNNPYCNLKWDMT